MVVFVCMLFNTGLHKVSKWCRFRGYEDICKDFKREGEREGLLIEDLEVKTFCNVQDSCLCMSGYSCGCEVSVSVSGITFGFMCED